jgi:uncharacterized membrane protein SpoIIM required for sporulation
MAIAQNGARRQSVCGIDRASGAIAQTVRRLPAALVAATGLLVGVLVVAMLSAESRQVPASGPPFAVGGISDAARIFGENLLVLSLYTMGNIAALVVKRWRAGEEQRRMISRKLVSQLAMAMVIGLLVFAACREAYALGRGLAGFSGYFYASPWRLWLGVLPHALPELTGIFLPVVVWFLAIREGKEHELLTYTAAAVLAALPLLATAALMEVYVSPKVFRALTCIGESEGFRRGGDCRPEPRECPKLSPAEFEKRYHIHLSQAEVSSAREHCSAAPKLR